MNTETNLELDISSYRILLQNGSKIEWDGMEVEAISIPGLNKQKLKCEINSNRPEVKHERSIQWNHYMKSTHTLQGCASSNLHMSKGFQRVFLVYNIIPISKSINERYRFLNLSRRTSSKWFKLSLDGDAFSYQSLLRRLVTDCRKNSLSH